MAHSGDIDDDDRGILAIIEAGIATSVSFDNEGNDATKAVGDGSRQDAIDYYKGVMNDLPYEEGWSSAVSRDVSDTIDQQMPGLMRVFAGTSDIVEFQPGRQGEEAQAKQATEYVNYVWTNECDGYTALYSAIMDALQVRNGILKVWWDDTPEIETEDLFSLDEMQLALLSQDPDVQITAHVPVQQAIQDPVSGQITSVTLYHVRVQHRTVSGRLMVECVAPEDFGLNSDARTLDEAWIVWHRTRPSRSDLVARGYDRDQVEGLPAYVDLDRADRNPNEWVGSSATVDKALDVIEVYEVYLKADLDGDGVAERCKAIVAGDAGSRALLSLEPWPDDLPFGDIKSQIVPHRWMGKSTADDVMDIQRIKTALLRQGLNNLYQVNNPRPAVRVDALDFPDDVLRPTPGLPIRINKQAVSVNDAVQWQVVPYIGDKVAAGMQAQDAIIQKRTGVSPATASLDATALDPQTATAEQIEHDAGYARTELVARTIANGLQDFFGKVLRVVVRHQDRPRSLLIGGNWVDYDPRAWNARMACTVKIGLGTGSRERDLTMLAGIGKQQDQIVAQMGQSNPFVTAEQYIRTRQKMVEASGLRDPDAYFTVLTNEQFAQWQQQQPPKPDPAMEKVKSQQQADAAKLQGQQQIAQMKQQNEAETQQAKIAAEMQMRREELTQEYALKMREIEMEAQLKAASIGAGIHQAGETQVAAPQ